MIDRETQPEQPSAAHSLMEEILADALAIEDRFVAEPMLKTTGRGMLKSRGAVGLRQDVEELRRKFVRVTRRKS